MLKSPLLLNGTSTSSSSSLPDEALPVEESAAKEENDQEVVEEQGFEKPQFDGFDCTDDEFTKAIVAAEAEAEIRAQVQTLVDSAEKASLFAQRLRKVSEDAHKTCLDTHQTYSNVHYLAVEATKAAKCAKDQLWAGQKKLKVFHDDQRRVNDEAVRFAPVKK